MSRNSLDIKRINGRMPRGLFAILSVLYLVISGLTLAHAFTRAADIVYSFYNFAHGDKIRRDLEDSDNNVRYLKEYDFIIVGAGSAGCVLAARLSENPNWKILLLEAGGSELLIMDLPALVHSLQQNDELNWGYRAQPSDKFCLGIKDNRCAMPRGRVMGGCSTINYMMYTRANRHDYDRWAEMGNEGWSYREVLPYFEKLENSSVPDAEPGYVGRGGPIQVSYSNHRSHIAEAFVGAVQEDGVPYGDYNGKTQLRVSYLQSTVDQQFRWSANRGYLYPIKRKRPNLHIRKNAFVTKILINPKTKTAYGVVFEANRQSYEVRARLEVISAAGAINTPQLLMLSGIGPAKHLRQLDIHPIVADLAVGFNLQDHVATGSTILVNSTSYKYNDFFQVDALLHLNTHDSILSVPGGLEALAFYKLDKTLDYPDWPDMELYSIGGGFHTNPDTPRALHLKDDVYDYLYKDIRRDDLNVFLIFSMLLRPRSRGRIMLRSKNPRKYPLIYPNYFHDPYDLDISIRGQQKIIELINKPSLRAINATLLQRKIPACAKYGDVTSRPYLECYLRQFTFTIYHQSGTAKMGPKTDRTAVVDSRLRVHGVNKLRVVDASIMPELVAGHPNGPVYMIAEKASDMIKEDYGFI